MPVINFKFTKINAEKGEMIASAAVNVDESVALRDITELSMNLNDSQKAARFVLEFQANYKQENEAKASINITSEVLFLDEASKIQSLVDNWKSKKPIDADLIAEIHNLALTKSLIQALILADSLALPSPINLPKIKVKTEQK